MFIIIQNIVVLCIVSFLLLFLKWAAGKPYWRSAWSVLRKNRLAMFSLFIISLYCALGILDSISWRDPMKTAHDETIKDSAGKTVLQPYPLSVLDRLFTPIRTAQEKTYSAPLAKTLLAKENVLQADGTTLRMYPELKSQVTHLLGTDKVGNDVLFKALKGIRTALIIGVLTSAIAIPFALFFGITAGYFGGLIDDAVQYVYTTLMSIPSILLMVAFLLLFGRGLTQLCVIMGITSWTGLCRLIRAESIKIRELEYVAAAEAMGVNRFVISLRHILPNVMHIVIISAVLRFSGLVLSEAILSYIGIGVGPETGSWGNMINNARLELARAPVVWWNLGAAFIFMLGLVLPANIFGDALRDALDPRLKE